MYGNYWISRFVGGIRSARADAQAAYLAGLIENIIVVTLIHCRYEPTGSLAPKRDKHLMTKLRARTTKSTPAVLGSRVPNQGLSWEGMSMCITAPRQYCNTKTPQYIFGEIKHTTIKRKQGTKDKLTYTRCPLCHTICPF